MNNPDHPIVFFDGICNLCSSSVQFIIRNDPGKKFRFASLQGITGQGILKQYGLSQHQLQSVLLLDSGKIFTRSTAALKIARKLSGGWPLMYALIIVPPFIRNAVYNWIATNRYQWFGKKESCWIPNPGIQSLFLD
jgi:predicted DCC family thiol-disulfide oxidoreductase YuxK